MYNELSLQQRIYLLRAGVLKEVTYTTTHIGVLFEEFLIESKSKTENDDMGKLHELRLAYHLSSDNDMDKHLPEHHRATNSEDPAHNGDPKTVHDRKIGRAHV